MFTPCLTFCLKLCFLFDLLFSLSTPAFRPLLFSVSTPAFRPLGWACLERVLPVFLLDGVVLCVVMVVEYFILDILSDLNKSSLVLTLES